jgi:hypothetical protein
MIPAVCKTIQYKCAQPDLAILNVRGKTQLPEPLIVLGTDTYDLHPNATNQDPH